MFLNRIIKEEYLKFLKEVYDDQDVDYSYFNRQDEIKQNLFSDFLYHNTPDFTKHVPWKVIPFPRLKKIWEDYMIKGFVRDERGLEMIKDLMIENTAKVDIFTNLAGHTQWGDEEAFKENIGYWVDEQLNCVFDKPVDKNQLQNPFNDPSKGHEVPEDNSPCDKSLTISQFVQEYVEENYNPDSMDREDIRNMLYDEIKGRFFDYYMNDPEGKMGGFISDYGLQPLLDLLVQLLRSTDDRETVMLIDRMLNVVHQRSDIASWFVEGGSHALAQLSGSPTEA